jgi:hypothetical protein
VLRWSASNVVVQRDPAGLLSFVGNDAVLDERADQLVAVGTEQGSGLHVRHDKAALLQRV